MKILPVLCLGLFMTMASTCTAAVARSLSPEDFRAVVQPADAQLSPDGRAVAVAYSRGNFATNLRPSSLELIDIASGASGAIAETHHDVKQPRWSPDGKTLAFIASDAKTAQIFLFDVAARTERQLTHAKHDVDDFAWRDDGTNIVYLAVVPLAAGWLAPYGDAFEAGDGSQTLTSRPEADQLFIVGVDGTRTRALTSGRSSVRSITAWHGSRIIVQRAPDAYESHSWKTAILAIDARTGAVRELAAAAPHASIAGFDGSGGLFAYTAPEGSSPLGQQKLFVRQKSGLRELTRRLDRDIKWTGWLGHDALLVIAVDKTRSALWRIALDGSIRRIQTGNIDPFNAASISGDGRIVFIGATPESEPEVYLLDSVDTRARALSHFNSTPGGVFMGRTTKLGWNGPDGFREYGVVTYPPHFDRSKKYPLVVLPVGGPGSASIEAITHGSVYTYANGWMRHLLASRGYVVFNPNYRGCDNMGRRYLSATINDLLEGPGRDIMSGVAALESAGSIDTKRLAISGHSEGGLFTAYLTARYHVWKAAAAIDGDYDLRDEYDYGDASAGNTNGAFTFLLGSTQTNRGREIFRRNSPLTYAASVRVPMLLIHFTGDPYVPVTEGLKERRALLDNGRDVTMVLFPVSAHFPSDPVHFERVTKLWLDWLTKHL